METKQRRRLFKQRSDPSVTERTIAALVSSASAKVHVDLANENPQINGVYMPEEDQIVLFRCKGEIPAGAVALEEAGHSLQRRDYLKYAKRALVVRDRLSQWHPQAQYILDWLEDARVYNQLKEQYPGCEGELDYVFDVREESLKKLAWRFGPGSQAAEASRRLHDVANEFFKVCQLYAAGPVPTTFEGVLEYCEKLVKSKPQTYAPASSQGNTLLVVGKDGNQNGQLSEKGLDIQGSGNLPLVALTVTVADRQSVQQAQQLGAGGYGGQSSWPVIDRRVMSVEKALPW